MTASPSQTENFGIAARYYAPPVFTSRDPLFEKYFWTTPYGYCNNNPLKYVDPTGMDWFENTETGAVFYNSSYGKDDAGKGPMRGSGWQHLGGNNMFQDKNGFDSDFLIYSDHKSNGSYNPTTGVIEMMFEGGGQAEAFMSDKGYKQVPTQVITYNDTYTESYPAMPGKNISITYGKQLEYTEKVGYVPESYGENGRSIVGDTEYGKLNYDKHNFPYANRQIISYSEPSALLKIVKAVFPGLETVHGGKHDYVDYYNMGNIRNYQGNNDLINRILNR